MVLVQMSVTHPYLLRTKNLLIFIVRPDGRKIK